MGPKLPACRRGTRHSERTTMAAATAAAPGVEISLKAGGSVTISPNELPDSPTELVEVLQEEEPPINAWLKVAVSAKRSSPRSLARP